MDRMGHSSTKAALIYLHGSDDRQQTIADGLSKLAQRALLAQEPEPPKQARGERSSPGPGTKSREPVISVRWRMPDMAIDLGVCLAGPLELEPGTSSLSVQGQPLVQGFDLVTVGCPGCRSRRRCATALLSLLLSRTSQPHTWPAANTGCTKSLRGEVSRGPRVTVLAAMSSDASINHMIGRAGSSKP